MCVRVCECTKCGVRVCVGVHVHECTEWVCMCMSVQSVCAGVRDVYMCTRAAYVCTHTRMCMCVGMCTGGVCVNVSVKGPHAHVSTCEHTLCKSEAIYPQSYGEVSFIAC